MNGYTQLCVWPGTDMSNTTFEELQEMFIERLDTRIKVAEVVITLPDPEDRNKVNPETGGRSDVFFYVHDEDVPKFAIPRLQLGIRWWEDVILNNGHLIYPEEILNKYPYGWGDKPYVPGEFEDPIAETF